MSPIGAIDRMVTLFLEMGPLGAVLLLLLAVGSMWLGYRFSRPSNYLLSIRRPPSDGALPAPTKTAKKAT